MLTNQPWLIHRPTHTNTPRPIDTHLGPPPRTRWLPEWTPPAPGSPSPRSWPHSLPSTWNDPISSGQTRGSQYERVLSLSGDHSTTRDRNWHKPHHVILKGCLRLCAVTMCILCGSMCSLRFRDKKKSGTFWVSKPITYTPPFLCVWEDMRSELIGRSGSMPSVLINTLCSHENEMKTPCEIKRLSSVVYSNRSKSSSLYLSDFLFIWIRCFLQIIFNGADSVFPVLFWICVLVNMTWANKGRPPCKDLWRLSVPTRLSTTWGSAEVWIQCKISAPFQALPKGVPDPVFEADEVLLVLGHQVPGVEVGVPGGEHVPQQPSLSQLFAAGVAEEGAGGAHLG